MQLLHIVQGTPAHIWALLAGLLAKGVSQSRPRTLGARRVAVLPLALTALSLAGVAGAFGAGAHRRPLRRQVRGRRSLAMHPELSHELLFATPVGFAYGLFSGAFAARGWQIWSARTAAPIAA